MEQSKLQTTVPAKPPYPWRVPIIYALLGGPLGAWLLAGYYIMAAKRLAFASRFG